MKARSVLIVAIYSLFLFMWQVNCARASCGTNPQKITCYYFKNGKLEDQSPCRETECGNVHGSMLTWEWDNGKEVTLCSGKEYLESCSCAINERCINVSQGGRTFIKSQPSREVSKGKLYCYGVKASKSDQLFCSGQ